ncbi:MAG: tape measure protein [Chloroflexota bacterium]|nr:tape measure protein [Chloroflexota bacterium]
MPDLNVALRIRADLQNAVRQVDRLEKELRQTGRAGRQAAQGTRQAAASIERAGRAADRSSRGFSKLQGAVAGIGFALLAREAVQAVRSITDTGLAFERLEQRFTFAAGSVRQGAEEFEFVRQEADRLGLSFRAASEGFTSLAAAARGTALEGREAREIFTSIAEAATVLQLSSEQTRGALTAVEQIISKGKVSAEELRGQLGERLPGAFQIAARAMGVTTAELDEMLVAGELLADDFLPRFAAEVRRTFADSVPDAANTAQASFNRLGNAIEELQNSIARSGLLDWLADVTTELTTIVELANQLPGQLETLERFGGDRSVPGGGLTRDQARLVRETSRGTIDAAGQGDTRAQLEIAERRLADALRERDELRARAARRPDVAGGRDGAALGTASARVVQLTAERNAIARVVEGEEELERFQRRRANQGTLRVEVRPPVDVEGFEKALEELSDARERSVREQERIELTAAQRSRLLLQRQLADIREHGRAAREAARGDSARIAEINEEQSAAARAAELAHQSRLTEIAEDEARKRRRSTDRAVREAQRDAERAARAAERLSDRQQRAALQVSDAVQEANLTLFDNTGYARSILAAQRWLAVNLRALAEVGLEHHQLADDARAAFAEMVKRAEEQRDVILGLRGAMRDYARQAAEAGSEAAGAFNSAVRGMEDALVSFVQTGKLSFSDLANSIIADIARIVVRQQILGPLVGAFGGGSLFGGLFHAGGQVGHGTRSRSVDPRAFAFAPRYHEGGVAGLRPDEVPAILQRGETVLPRGAGVPMPVPITVNFENRGTPQREVESRVRLDPYGVVVDIVVDNLENGGPIRDAVRRTQGAGL